jgi:hypothetical protein
VGPTARRVAVLVLSTRLHDSSMSGELDCRQKIRRTFLSTDDQAHGLPSLMMLGTTA